jgi:CHAT domain-containing protein
MLPLDVHCDVIDKYQISVLVNTADLLRDTIGLAPRSISIFADPLYSDGKPIASAAIPTAHERGTLNELAATRTEALGIASTFRSAGWTVDSYLASDASESNLNALHHQQIVHIATHATFRADTVTPHTITNELLNCSLYFSGANRTLRNGSSDPHNDGVVSGLEAMYLDLQGTDLITLSACESGRGSIEPGEGVFGMPRALRTSGARNILMSLWRIPDRETSELMSLFYKKLLQGESKASALRSAQLKMRATIKKRWGADEPLFWAGFELIGF